MERRQEPLSTYLRSRSADVAIKRNGVLEISTDPTFLEPIIKKIVEGMVKLTDDTTRHAHFPWEVILSDLYGKGYEQEVGLRRPEDNKRGERKFTFQYRPQMVPRLIERGTPVAEYQDFLTALYYLDEYTKSVAIAVAETFDETNRRRGNAITYPGSFAERLREGSCTIRVLRYLVQKEEIITLDLPDAAPHIDRSALTVHSWASHAGLRVFGHDHTSQCVDETSFGSVAVFPGEKFAAITRGIFGYGTPHGVRDERRKAGQRDGDRFAIVCFMHPIAKEKDAQWLLANKHLIETYEKSFKL